MAQRRTRQRGRAGNPRQARGFPLVRALLAASLACAPIGPALLAPLGEAAAQEQDAPAYEGRLIRNIRLEGIEKVDPALVRQQLRAQVGQPLRAQTLTEDIRRLNRLGRFRTVRAEVELYDDAAVEVVYIFSEAPIVQDVQVTGNSAVKTAELATVVRGVGLRAGVPVDDFNVGKARRAIEDYYRERGHYTVEVFVDERELTDNGVVLFRVREGERVRVTDIRFEGVESLDPRQVRGQLQTKVRGLIRRGPLDEEKLEADIATIIRIYRDRGRLDVRADRRITPSPDGREAIITFVIDEGPQYRLRHVRVRNAAGDEAPLLFSEAQTAGLLALKRGDVYAMRQVRVGVSALERAYWRLGYADAQVQVQELRAVDEPAVDILLTITEGKRYRTGEVLIQGNTLTRQNVIRRQVQVRPDTPLDRGGLEDSRRRIAQTRLFDTQANPPRITIQPERPDEPGYRDILVEVQETNTGSLAFIVAANSDLGFTGSLSLTQSNFDITNPPETVGEFLSAGGFRGGGQTFNITLSPGNEVQNYGLSLSDPNAFDTETSFNTGVSWRDRVFRQYDEERYGGRIGLGRRLGDRWSGSLSFRAESVELTDIDDDAPVDIFEVADPSVIYGLGLRLSRTTVPPGEGMSPSRGVRTSFSIEQVFGDFNFTKIQASQSLFFTVSEDILGRRSKVSLSTNIGYIPQSGEAPTYERFYLGGRNFRGFDTRTVAPKGVRNDTGEIGNEAVGGEWLFFAGVEYEQPIYGEVQIVPGIVDPIFSGVVFLDSGTVVNDPGFDDYRVSAGFGLRIRVPALGPTPLAFDFGFPLVRQDGDRTQLFSFSLDLPF